MIVSSHDHTWRTADGRFGVRMANDHLVRMLRWCRNAGINETGGILAGHYTSRLDQAIITHISSAPKDSHQGQSWFSRGTHGLQSWLDQLWRKEQDYYLGEWHYHPYAPPRPSTTDEKQMQKLARDANYHCPEPVLILVGGNPREAWQVRAFVYSDVNLLIELYPVLV